MVNVLSSPLITAQNATGNVRNYQIIVGGIQLLNLPISYLMLKTGYEAEIVFQIAILIEIIALFARLFMLPQTIKEFNPNSFISSVVLNCLLVSICSIAIPLLISHLLPTGLFSFIINSTIVILFTAASILMIGCNKNERILLFGKLRELKKKIS